MNLEDFLLSLQQNVLAADPTSWLLTALGVAPSPRVVGKRSLVPCGDGSNPHNKCPKFDNLYDELAMVAEAAWIADDLGMLLFMARNVGMAGLPLTPSGYIGYRSLTVDDVIRIIEQNETLLWARSEFAGDPGRFAAALQRIKHHARCMGGGLPMSFLQYDDEIQRDDLVYFIGRNDVDRQIIVAFRGNRASTESYFRYDNQLSEDEWKKDTTKQMVPLPPFLQGKLGSTHHVWLHRGLYRHYVRSCIPFSRLQNDINGPAAAVSILLNQHPDYKLYSTGHGYGAVFATYFAFLMACEEKVPTPVTAVPFGSPRLGDKKFLDAVEYLERNNRLRVCRMQCADDNLCFEPVVNYSHVGFQVRLYSDRTQLPEVSYPQTNDTPLNRLTRSWKNSVLMRAAEAAKAAATTSTMSGTEVRRRSSKFRNANVDSNYYCLDRFHEQRSALEDLNLDIMYDDPNWTGWQKDIKK